MRNNLNWTVGFSASPEVAPSEFVPAVVPGAVQLDWARAHNWPDHNVGDNWKEYGWMEDVYWLYRASLPDLQGGSDSRIHFVAKGIDYRFQVRVDRTVLLDQEGMFTPVDLDITSLCSPGAVLEVLVWPAPKSASAPVDRSQANRSCKPAVSYDWDFHPRLIPLGIWDEAFVDVRPAVNIKSANLQIDVSDDLGVGVVELKATLNRADDTHLIWSITDPSGRAVHDHAMSSLDSDISLTAAIPNPELWWPHAEGEQPLYRSSLRLVDADGRTLAESSRRIGFRRVRLVMHPTAWDEPADFPKTRSNPPITLEINGRRIFAKGSNWVSPSIFPGEITAGDYSALLGLVRDANLSIVRCWGGAIVNKDAFFDTCDELGIMVWQEFPLACNDYPDDPAYLRVLDQESRAIITRLRQHPSVVIWCGGNELFNVWSGMTDQSHALRLLGSNCYQLDPRTPFLPTSPVMGMGHGPYLFRNWDGVELFESMPKADKTAYTEFATAGTSSVETLRRIIPADQFWPPKRGTAWQSHHGFGAWGPETSTWLMLDVLEDYFGPTENVEQMVERGQMLQAEGLKCIYEGARRQKPTASMALNWCFNEPWPCVANNSIVEWPAKPKPGYHAVAAACRPTLASAQVSKFRWREGDIFAPELWLLHDGPAAIDAGRIEAALRIGDAEHFLLGWDHGPAAPNTNLIGPIVRFVLPQGEPGRMTLILRCLGHAERDSQYNLLYAPSTSAEESSGTRTLNT